MGLYGFKARFEAPILAGTKRHTIRANRKDGWVEKPGATMHLYIGLRQKGARCFAKPICSKVERIVIDGDRQISIAGERLTQDEMEQLARCDGFNDYADMMSFWPDEKLPFFGHITHWRPL